MYVKELWILAAVAGTRVAQQRCFS